MGTIDMQLHERFAKRKTYACLYEGKWKDYKFEYKVLDVIKHEYFNTSKIHPDTRYFLVVRNNRLLFIKPVETLDNMEIYESDFIVLLGRQYKQTKNIGG